MAFGKTVVGCSRPSESAASIFQILSRSVQYSFRRILLLLLLKFHNGIYVTGSAPERAPVAVYSRARTAL
eukprot:COSAG01_NODE_7118_length_3342_cov_22.941104_3_plen_70_part_00